MEIKYNFSVEPNENVEENEFNGVDFTANDTTRELKVRLDKWLWAARFFKTRALARSAVENGKVLYNDQKANPNMEIQVGATVQINFNNDCEKRIIIEGLSTRRKNSENALNLFKEVFTPKQSFKNEHDHPAPKKTSRFLRRSFSRKENQSSQEHSKFSTNQPQYENY